LNILFEDKDIIIINKQPGIVVHPAPGNWSGTLVNGLLFHCPDIQSGNEENRPGIVHRLDKNTSGVMVVAKNRKSLFKLSESSQSREVKNF
jgi:23S rRNA pseudouridine1911/1915/1917 synthase